MFFQLLYIHLFRPFLKYNPNNSPLPANVSPRKHCTQAAAMISKLLRLYKRSHGLRQICNICVYIAHSACTIHLLNLPEKNAKRDIIHGVKHLEEIAEGWICARRTLGIMSTLAKRWKVELPEEAAAVLARTEDKFGPWSEVSTPKATPLEPVPVKEQQRSSTQASPILQSHNMAIAHSTPPQYFCIPATNNTSVSIEPFRRSSDARTHSRPPSSANTLAHPRIQRHLHNPLNQQASPQAHNRPATPASTQTRQSVDGHSAAGDSPSQLFGGVDQLIREGRDWIFRDQAQLADGFDNWNHNYEDIASWFASTGGSPGAFQATPAHSRSATMNGGPVGAPHPNAYINGNLNGNGVGANGSANANANGMGLQGFTYDERSLYDYQ